MRKKIMTVSMVKNESDIIESFVRHSLSFADEMLILDHMSTDETYSILKKLQEEGLPLILRSCYRVEYAQSGIMTDLLYQAVVTYGADIVLPLDADEFLVNTETRQSCRELLQNLDSERVYQLRTRTYELLAPQGQQDIFLLLRPCRRERDFTKSSKIIVGAGLCGKESLRVAQGNHYVMRESSVGFTKDGQAIPMEAHPLLHLAHYQWRGEEQMTSKCLLGWLHVVTKYSVNTQMGWHWKNGYHQAAEGHPINIVDSGTIQEPEVFDLSPYVASCVLQYTKGLTMEDVRRNFLLTGEQIAEAYLEGKVLLKKRVVTFVLPYCGTEEALRDAMNEVQAQTYPYKEVFVICLQRAPSERAKQFRAKEMSVEFLSDSDGEDVFSQLERKAKGDYVQWIFPGDGMRPDKVMKMVAFMEAQEFRCPLAVVNGETEFADWMPYMDVLHINRAATLKTACREMWKDFLRVGKYFSGGIAAMLVRRSLMDERHWLRDGFAGGQPLFLSMFRILLNAPASEVSPKMAILQADYMNPPSKRIRMTDWLWHQIEWGYLLREDKELLSMEYYENATESFRKNYAFAIDKRTETDALLWEQYDMFMKGLDREQGDS